MVWLILKQRVRENGKVDVCKSDKSDFLIGSSNHIEEIFFSKHSMIFLHLHKLIKKQLRKHQNSLGIMNKYKRRDSAVEIEYRKKVEGWENC